MKTTIMHVYFVIMLSFVCNAIFVKELSERIKEI